MNDWLRILEALKDGKFPDYDYGLTLRFIVGGCQIPIGKKFETEDAALEATRLMYEEMKSFNKAGFVVTSNKCDKVNGPVMDLSECKWSESCILESFDEIWGRYGQEIIDGNYHINPAELKILEKIFGV
jgi:hypothetical protein